MTMVLMRTNFQDPWREQKDRFKLRAFENGATASSATRSSLLYLVGGPAQTFGMDSRVRFGRMVLEVVGARPDPLDDPQNAESRCLLYECYHAATAIVREYYRRCSDSDDREMPARKRLTQALRKLDKMDDMGKERRPHPTGEASPKKRPR